MRRAVIMGVGAALPERIVTNADLEKTVDTSHDWIVSRTGIEQRHIAADGQLTSDLAAQAGKQALANAGVSADSIDMVILATTTPDDTMPATATKVQRMIGAVNAAAFDVNAACSGFVYAMTVANSLIVSGQAKRILLIGAETYSRILDWNDRGTCILFGDGAAALVLEAQEQKGSSDDRGVLYCGIRSDGQTELLGTSGGVSSTQKSGFLFMSGKEIYRNAVTRMPEAVVEGLKSINLPLESIDWLVPHQANLRILAGVGQKLAVAPERVISTVQKHANTSAASIPLALYQAAQDGRLQPGQLIACPALGAGLTWGCVILRW
ncbi:MAG: beta-ketoacyl-ACP synthase III [Alphaproteobacteria bacterium]|nr:beta-ketoacyl-ACP synthase III [Alphaproteobacteria bacterium]